MRRTPLRTGLSLLTTVLLTLGAGGCASSGSSGATQKTPAQVLSAAEKALETTSGVKLTLATDDLPSSVQGIKGATGVLTKAPAFDGSLTVVLSGQPFNVPVVAVGGKVYAQIPLTPGWQQVNPKDYGAPDPSTLMSSDHGFASILAATTGLKRGSSVRGGPNNNEILTQYTGTVPGTAVQALIPSASGDFTALYTIANDGQLREAKLTGVFYQKAPSMTYTLGFDGYGTQKDIKAP